MNIEVEIRHQICSEIHRRMMVEGMQKLEKALHELSEEEVWERPNLNSNSVGNLILHLSGNIRQYVMSGIGKQEDQRKRQAEFDSKEPIPKAKLLDDLRQVMDEAQHLMQQLTPKQLIEPRKVQCFDETVVSILIHVIEHFTYHLGQIVYIVKAKKDKAMDFYEGLNLNANH